MNLLLDVNIVLDLCVPRVEWQKKASQAIQQSEEKSDSLWLYTGSVQTLVYTLYNEIRRDRPGVTSKVAMRLALKELKEFSKGKQWIAALASEGDVFGADDPEDEQLIRSLDRFPIGDMKLLTRDQKLLDSYPDKTISPGQYCNSEHAGSQLNFIDLKAQQNTIRPQLEKNIHTVFHHGRYILGPEVKELETRLADYAGAKHCIGVSSGTDALLMPLMAWGIGPGDAVFTTPFTFIATAEVIQLLGATPIFVDIDPETFNIDPVKLKPAIQAIEENDSAIHPFPKTRHSPLIPKAVIPVDLFGLPADYDPIMQIAQKHGLKVLSDSAQGFGSEYKGKRSGSLAHATTTSFFPAKPLGGYGDGGAIFTDDDNLADIVQSIRVHGKGKDKYDNIRIGLNARLHTMQAAILLAKLEKFPWELEAKQKKAEKYTELLSTQSCLSPPHVPKELRSAWAQYSILAQSTEQRQKIQDSLKEKGIPSMVYYTTPLHIQTAFAHLGYQPEDMPVAMDVAKRIFSLPMHAYLREEQIAFIAKRIQQ